MSFLTIIASVILIIFALYFIFNNSEKIEEMFFSFKIPLNTRLILGLLILVIFLIISKSKE